MKILKSAATTVILLLVVESLCWAGENTLKPDLSKIVKNEGWTTVNRSTSVMNEAGKKVIHLDGQPGDGVVWMDGFEFKNGIIEIDIKGKDVQGKSFVGIAFRGVDEKTYDAVYFRPFNFMSADTLRRSHGVQYISYPKYTWEKLRDEFPGKYENRVSHVTDPNAFFHAKIVVERPTITVYVNKSDKPCLVVKELSERSGGRIGLWVGNYSDGSFSNLTIVKAD